MKFKDARNLGKSLANEGRFAWVYLYQTRDREWWVSDCENFQSDNWYYLHRDGRILNYKLYESWKHSAPLSSGNYPFSPSIPGELYNKKGNKND